MSGREAVDDVLIWHRPRPTSAVIRAGRVVARSPSTRPGGQLMAGADDHTASFDVTAPPDGDASVEVSDSTTVADSLPAGVALLAVRRGPNAGARFLLDHDV